MPKSEIITEPQRRHSATQKLWRSHHLTYDQARYVAKEVRRTLALERPTTRQRTVMRLSRDEEQRLISHAYRTECARGRLIKTLFRPAPGSRSL
jgi:hypothetical protein